VCARARACVRACVRACTWVDTVLYVLYTGVHYMKPNCLSFSISFSLFFFLSLSLSVSLSR